MKTDGRFLVFALLLVAGFATAAPVTYTFVADNASGTRAGVAFGPGATVVFIVNADTTAVAAANPLGSPGTCVLGTSGTVSVDGGATSIAITGPVYVCTAPDGFGAGIYNGPGGNAYLVVSPQKWTGVGDLTTSFGPLPPTIPNALTSHGAAFTINVTGGTFSMTEPRPSGNPSSAASSFGAVVAAVAPATPVPTLSEWGLIILSSLLALIAATYLTRRRKT